MVKILPVKIQLSVAAGLFESYQLQHLPQHFI